MSRNMHEWKSKNSVDGGPGSSQDMSEGINFTWVAPVKTNEILELTPLFLQTSIVHFNQVKDRY